MAAMADVAPFKSEAARAFNGLQGELTRQGGFAAPPIAASVLTLNHVVVILTVVYLLLQILYLCWKWRREKLAAEAALAALAVPAPRARRGPRASRP